MPEPSTVFSEQPAPDYLSDYGAFSKALLGGGPSVTLPRPQPMDASVATARSAAALEERKAASEKSAQAQERTATELEESASTLDAQGKSDAAARAAAKPGALALPAAPSAAARAFLEPGQSVLGQLQTAVLAISQLGMQAAGLGGSAIAATAAMKGMAEGWAQGDGERVKREYAEWRANTTRLIQQHEASREAYQDLLTDQKLTMDQRLQALTIRAQAQGHRALAEKTRGLDSIDAVLKQLQHDEGIELQIKEANARTAQWYATAVTRERDFLALQEQRRLHQERADRAEKRQAELQPYRIDALRMPVQAQKLAESVQGLNQRMDSLDALEDAVAVLKRKGILATGGSPLDALGVQAAVLMATKDPEVGKAINAINRYGTGDLIGMEMQLGATASSLRIKAIDLAAAGNPLAIPEGFWNDFLPRARRNFDAQRNLKMRELSGFREASSLLAPALNAGRPSLGPVSQEEWDAAR